MTGAQVAAAIAAYKRIEVASYSRYSKDGLADVKQAVQAATMWNFIYTPVEYGPLAPVARGWDFTGGVKQSPDFSYVIFCWVRG